RRDRADHHEADHRGDRQADHPAHAERRRRARRRRPGQLRLEPVTAFVARWIHLVSSILLVGGAATLLLAGPSDRPTARRWEAWILRACSACVLVALASALVAVAAQAALLEGRAAAALEPAALRRFLLQTQG